MADDQNKKPMTDDTKDLPFHTLDDQQEDSVDVTDTDLEAISDQAMTPDDEAIEDDEITFSELEEDDDATDEENNDVDNLMPNVDEGTE